MAAMVGIGSDSSLLRPSRRCSKNCATCGCVIVRRSTRSAPAQKEPSVDERTMSARMELSKWACSRHSRNCWEPIFYRRILVYHERACEP